MKKYITILIISLFIGINFTYAKEKVTFNKCIDGDTIKVIRNNKKETVRLLAVDTPEIEGKKREVEYYGKESSEYTCKKIKEAKKIELEYDKNSDERDKYDRILAWVFVDGELLEELLVEKGYAKVAYLYGDYKYTSILQEKQELASAKGKGIWNKEASEAFNNNPNPQAVPNNIDVWTNREILIIVILFLIIVFIGDKSIKKKAKKKLKNYLD